MTDAAVEEPSASAQLLRSLFSQKSFVIGGTVVLVIAIAAILAPWLTQYGPAQPDIANRLKPPFWDPGSVPTHLLGTDQIGRDYLTRLLYGARISLVIGLVAVAISATIGITLGLVAGYFGGRVDAVIGFVITTRLSMPIVLIALAVVAIAGGSLLTVTLVIGLLIWDQFAVVTRTATQQARSADYVRAAEAMGCSLAHILAREILPNILPAVIVVATVELANAILLEAALSFLGLGVQAPLPSWGLMLSEGKNYMFFDPWLITLPGLCLFTLTMAINLMGDGLRDGLRGGRR
ncbi:ABC transporter permease [Acuticoccus sediminis]|uniref:ABC transporter permease n=1 Tax=Acuticoccus sediminis TaxID=2184697 RepID=UPI001CFD6DD1|nr:ABC transporter permease [Acuticoccus sediminis]